MERSPSNSFFIWCCNIPAAVIDVGKSELASSITKLNFLSLSESPILLSTCMKALLSNHTFLLSPTGCMTLLSSVPLAIKKECISLVSKTNLPLPVPQSFCVASKCACGLSIIGSMWSPDERVKRTPFKFSRHAVVSIFILDELTKLGDVVFAFGPQATVVISKRLNGIYPQSILRLASIFASLIGLLP